MKSASYQVVDEKELLDTVFSFLVNQGLENASIRKICKGTGIVQGSLYYWFDDKDTIICEATEYGLKKLSGNLFDYMMSGLTDIDKFFSECLDRISEYRSVICFIFQMASSPKYGERTRNHTKDFKRLCVKYTESLSLLIQSDTEILKPFVDMLMSALLNYAVWDDKEIAKIKVDYIYKSLKALSYKTTEQQNSKRASQKINQGCELQI